MSHIYTLSSEQFAKAILEVVNPPNGKAPLASRTNSGGIETAQNIGAEEFYEIVVELKG